MSNPTAAIIIIGNEILSGRTLDTNTQHIAQKLSEIGITLIEVRIIADNHQAIISNVSELRTKHDYIFTTGGIGPTHDDITSKAIADAFNTNLELNHTAYKIIKESYKNIGQELNQAREKMACLPQNSIIINNPISGAPGFIIENVYVMAGVPYIMHAMLEQILPTLKHGKILHSKNIDIMIGESMLAKDFSSLQNKYPEVEMGSYPFKTGQNHGTSLVLRSIDIVKLEQAYNELLELVKNFNK
jgi:molybdenum cofactor synthesis domain-containing protein